MNILYPIAGFGTRFKNNGYDIPKPLVEVNGKTLLEYSIKTLDIEGNYIFVSLLYENGIYNEQIETIINKCCINPKIIWLKEPTKGAAETCLKAEALINTQEPIIVTNVDQYLNWCSEDFIQHITKTDVDGCVSLYDHDDIVVGQPSKYAFVSLDANQYALEFREKFAISNNALNGIHYWKCGFDFVYSLKQMINDDIRVNNEYYISPSYNYLIKNNKRINTYKMSQSQYRSLGSPEEINKNQKYIK